MATLKCPFCAEEIQEEAVKCKHCGSWLVATPENQTNPHPQAAGHPVETAYGPRRLMRSSQDRMQAGVCGGIAQYMNLDPTLVRIAYVVLSLFTAFFPGFILYIILAIIVPSDDSVPRY